ncbi:MAG TPA: ParA family protein [Geminicoccaceae bacterium]|nr:ParA family protein [Geminicoccaceae bacterium]
MSNAEQHRGDHSGPRIVAIVNQKGGVGKTTTAINLGAALAAAEREVLVIDLDPQGNASTGMGVAGNDRERSAYDVLMNALPVDEAIRETAVPGLWLVPSSIDLSGAEVELVRAERREVRLSAALLASHAELDYVLIDCPPGLGLLTINALVAADSVLVPLQTEFLALEGLSHLLRTVERVRKMMNRTLKLQGIVLTMVDKRNKLSEAVANEARDYFADRVYAVEIPRNVRVSEAPSHGLPVLVYDPRCAGAQAYIRLAAEFLQREEGAAAAADLADRVEAESP